MKIAIVSIIVVALLPLARQGWSQEVKIRPGLWEHTFTINTQSGEMEEARRQMQEQLAALPSDQRKMMEQMMAAQGMAVGPRENAVKVCITKEDAERYYLPQKEKCRQKVVERTGNSLRIRFECPGDPPTSGESEITLLGPDAYQGRTTIDTRVNGKPERIEMNQAGKWLAEDCGDVKPYRRP